MQIDPRAIVIYTDGSYYRNKGGKSGCAAIAHFPDEMARSKEQIVDYGVALSTVPRMELTACIRALQWILDNEDIVSGRRVQILTDSSYVANGTRSATTVWCANGYRSVSGAPVANEDLWRRFVSLRRRIKNRLDISWVKGKETFDRREVDKAAKRAAETGTEVDLGLKGVKFGKRKTKGTVRCFPARGDVLVIRPYYSIGRRKFEQVVRFEVFAEEAGEYTGAFYAYCKLETAASLHRGNGFRVRFNSDARYPQIVEILETVSLKPAKNDDSPAS